MTDPLNPETQPAAIPQSATDDHSLPSGLTLAKRFNIVRFIARGGMGDVYEAEDSQLHERVALKTVRPDIAADPKNVERFKREIALARKVTHPNVCRIYDLFEDAGGAPGDPPRYFLTMELLNGETLTQAIKARGHFTTAEALPLVKQMAHALHTAHRAGVVHRDFKSPNVILVADPASPGGTRAVVSDFGLAHVIGPASGAEISTIGSFMGSPAYMAPEQVEGKEVGPAADIYAFGAVLYEMMTGRFPFSGSSPMAIAVKRLHEAPPSPKLHTPDLDPRWEAVIMRCLERNPEDRFPGLAEAVRALTEPLPAPAAPPPMPGAVLMAPPLATAAPHAANPQSSPGFGLRVKDTAGATICPQCERMLPGYDQCPVCKVPTVTRRDDAGNDYMKAIVTRMKNEKRSRLLKKLILPAISLVSLSVLLGVIFFPVPVPVMPPVGEASQQLMKASWDDFRDKVKFNQPSHFEMTDAQLTALVREQPGFEKAVFKIGATLAIYLPLQKIPAMLRLEITPVLHDNKVTFRVDAASVGLMPIPKSKVESVLAEKTAPLRELFQGVTGMTLAPGKLRVEYVPRDVHLPNGAVNWQVIH